MATPTTVDYQTALEASRAYKDLHVRLRQLGLHAQADEAKHQEESWQRLFLTLSDTDEKTNAPWNQRAP